MKELAEQVERAAARLVEEGGRIRRRDLLSTGSTLLNLACADNPFGGFLKGKYYFLVGDSAAGKTFLAMTTLAEAAISRMFKDYRLFYDNPEDGCLLDLEHLFNEEIANRIEPPQTDDDGNPIYSTTIEEFYYHLDDACKGNRPFIYVLDSMDSLISDSSVEKFEEQKEAHRKGKDSTGSYGDGKAKINSENLRRVLAGIRRTGSILIIISQTRDNLGFGFEKKTRSGGRALRFYATMEIWLSVCGSIKKEIHGKKREIGIRANLEVRKNRITGKRSEVEVDIYPSFGIDDLGSVVDYLVEEGFWKKTAQTITATELELVGTRDKLLREIEEKGLQDQVRAMAGKCWVEIAEACALKRAKRYAVLGSD